MYRHHFHSFYVQGTIPLIALLFAALVSIVTITGLVANPLESLPKTDIRTEPRTGRIVTGEEFTIDIVVESSIPVNAFEGTLSFDNNALTISKIDYNTSIADLWVEKPWYSNGEGTLYFAGGTTKAGGFSGTGSLITITFLAQKEGAGYISIDQARIMKHDGLGTDANITLPIDSIFTIQNSSTTRDILHKQSTKSSVYTVQDQVPSTDLNGDGKQTITDLSIFMLHMTTGDMRSDFNQDGSVTLKDMSILLNAYTTTGL